MLFHEEGLGAATEHGVAFGPGVVKPTSRGAVTLRTASPYVKPRIQHNYLTTDEDRATILAGTKVALEIAEQDAFDGIITGAVQRPRRSDADDDELWSFIEDQTMTIFHPTSTCAIGPVVDPRLRVHGTRRAAGRRRLGDADRSCAGTRTRPRS